MGVEEECGEEEGVISSFLPVFVFVHYGHADTRAFSAVVAQTLPFRLVHDQVVLELGGNAACIVEPDADIEDVVNRAVIGGFYQSGALPDLVRGR
jgi:aldehyde dehydrogenase family protein